MFGSRGGFELVAGRFTSGEDLDAGQMAALLLPLGQCVKFLVKEVVCPILLPAVNQALQFVASLEEKQLRGQVSSVLSGKTEKESPNNMFLFVSIQNLNYNRLPPRFVAIILWDLYGCRGHNGVKIYFSRVTAPCFVSYIGVHSFCIRMI